MEKMNLLICDDEWMIRESIVQTALSMEEFNVFTAVTGRTALELLEEEEIDGVVLDMQMPEMDGITFLQHMKSRKKDCAVKMCIRDRIQAAPKRTPTNAFKFLPPTFESILLLHIVYHLSLIHILPLRPAFPESRRQIPALPDCSRRQDWQAVKAISPLPP